MDMKKGMIAAAAIALLGTGAVGVASTYAAEQGAERYGRFDTIVRAIADRFHVNEEDVLAVFEEEREQMREEAGERFKARVAEAIDDGVLTQAQADSLLAHREEMREFHESLKGMTKEERQNAVKEQSEKNQEWKKETGIPAEFLKHVNPEHRPEHGGTNR
jgi:hypothetical protein